ncbi:MAG: PKD domain-containing protein [Bacteroidetes bacterium]|nr:PKD domain-containing protein [Bacteroidota bacterium]
MNLNKQGNINNLASPFLERVFAHKKLLNARNQMFMEMIKKTAWLLLLPLFLLVVQFNTADAQTCNPAYTGAECVGAPISFKANSVGYTVGSSTWVWDFGDSQSQSGTTANDRDPVHTYAAPGTYTVKLTVSGTLPTCTKSITVTIQPSPVVNMILVKQKEQCFENNQFCFIDSNKAATSSSTIVRRTLLFSDGAKYDKINPVAGEEVCHTVIDPKGGYFDLTIELEDANGCVTKTKISDAIRVWPRLGVSITSNQPTQCDSTLATIVNQTYIDWKAKPLETIGLKDVGKFVFDFGDGEVIVGDSVTNTSYWTGKALDGKVGKWYRKNGTFNAKLTVTSRFGCTETYQYKAAATNIKINRIIVADNDSTCTSTPQTCFKVIDPTDPTAPGPIPGAQWLWNFGDPPSGPDNTNDKTWTPCHSYGGGPWMISLRIKSGPCDIQLYDTISKMGPSSTIEVPFVRVLESEKYQCNIKDSVHFVNNSSFSHDDWYYFDEDSTVLFYNFSFKVVKHVVTGVDSIYTYRNMDTLISKYALTDTIFKNGYKIYFDQAKDSFVISDATGTFTDPKTRGGINAQRRYVFNFNAKTRAGDQTAIPLVSETRKHKYNVFRLWTLGDNFAPTCTTDTKANKNVNLNCNFTLDSLPVHWYTPWDDIYHYSQNGNRYTSPAPKTLFSTNSRTCYKVFVYPKDTMIVPQEVVLFVPFDSSRTFIIPYTDSVGVARTDTFKVEVSTVYPEIQWRHNYRLKIWRPKNYYTDAPGVYYTPDPDSPGLVITHDTMYPCKNTIIWEDQDYYLKSGSTLAIKDLNNATYSYETGPGVKTIDKDMQFEVSPGDTLFSRSKMVINKQRVVIAAASTIIVDTTTASGKDSFFTRSVILVDSAFHRDYFYNNVAACNSVTLYHQDTVHPFYCESSNNISLALIPPNARGLKWESGVPCPLDGNKLQYYLIFNMQDTKPGCTQQWFEVNYDSLTAPNGWVNYKSGAVLAPPPPGLPIPFVLPYDIIGQWGTKFVKGYSSGEIGNDPDARPNGSFTIGLVVGNGPPRFDKAGNPIAPECTDTAWYSDMFRYQYLDAQFEVLVPYNNPLALCAGETAYFRMVNPIQDSIAALRWNWGYPDRLSGYYEEFKYFQDYNGPVAGRNDEKVSWKKTDKWLYNYVVRHTLDEVFGDEVIDTIVTRIYRKWDVKINTYRADKVVSDLLKSLDLDIRDIPEGQLPLMLGDGTFGCIDTTGLSEYFVISKVGISKDIYFDGPYKYHYTDAGHTNAEIVEEVLHFRDSSMQGFDTLVAPKDYVTADGQIFKVGQRIPGVYKFTYRHAEVHLNFCDPTQKDTIWKNSNGPMIPGIFMNNTTGCEKTGAALINVGYLNLFELQNEAVCQGDVHVIDDSIRYWQYGDQAFPDDYPIDPRPFWEDPARYLANKEIKEVDWDVNDPSDTYERSIKFSHVYADPGEYLVGIATKDSIGCTDTSYVTAFVTGIKAGFQSNIGFDGGTCKNIVSFYDTTKVFDPCRGRDTCPNSNYEPCDSIVWYEWDFGDGSRTSVLKNPSHDYTSNGYFTVRLVVWSLLGCQDTITETIFIAGPQPEFAFSDFNPWGNDSMIICIGDQVKLDNNSKEPMYTPDFVFYWGDSTTSSSSDPTQAFIHSYKKAGTYYLSLYQVDEVEGTNIRCGSLFPDTSTLDGKIPREIKVIVQPIAPASFIISDTVVCRDEPIIFTSTSDTIYKYFTWDFGQGDTITRFAPDYSVTKSFPTVGRKSIKMVPNYDLPPGDFGPKCIDTAWGYVNIVDVKSYFSIDEEDKPEFCFNDSSSGHDPTLNEWLIEGEDRSINSVFSQNTCYNWGETKGTFEVCLVVTSPEGCKDTSCQTIENDFFVKIVPYNVFTPDDEDAVNRNFVIDIEGWEEYEIEIHNRWGEVVFKTDDPLISWDGTIMNKGTKCPGGTYFYVINYKLKNRPENDGNGPISGTVTLIR